MRGLADADRLRRFLRELAREAEADAVVYLTGGATAVLLGWRESTIDADILIVPEHDSLYRALPRLKEELQLNVEIASPAHFIPELPGWRERSLFIEREGRVSYYHYDPYSQALAKIERARQGPGRRGAAPRSRPGGAAAAQGPVRGHRAAPPPLPGRRSPVVPKAPGRGAALQVLAPARPGALVVRRHGSFMAPIHTNHGRFVSIRLTGARPEAQYRPHLSS